MDIMMISERYRVMKIKKKTAAKMFKNVQVGDVLTFRTPIRRAGGNGGTYATGITTTLERTKESTVKTFNELPTILQNFILEIATEENEFDFV